MKIARMDVYAFRARVGQTVVTSFSSIPSRAMALVRLEDADGAHGWGEIWGNFPPATVEYRATLAAWALPQHLIGVEVAAPAAFSAGLAARLHVLALQADEPGPIASLVAATNQALRDLEARREGLPLRRLLSVGARDRVPAYASGLNPHDGIDAAARCREEGYRAFKLKIGFGDDTDRANMAAIARNLRSGDRLFVDANQKWDLDEALRQAAMLAEFGVGWLEEPMPVDRPAGDWQRLADASAIPLAGGENMRDMDDFRAANGWLGIVQPDVGKWGGVDGCLGVARIALDAGRTYCPHWLSGGIGLLHSAHLLAAAGGDGLLEIDSNENPLRTLLTQSLPPLRDGMFVMNDEPGIGIDPPLDELHGWLVSHETFH